MQGQPKLPPLTSWVAGAGGDREPSESQLSAVLVGYLLAQRPFAGGAHLGLIGVVVALLWGSVSPWFLLGWGAAVALGGLLCGLIVRRGRRRPEGVLANLRFVVFVIGMAWGAGGGMIFRFLPEAEQWFVLVSLVGLIAGSAISLLADPVSFAIFQAAVLAGLLLPGVGADLAQDTVLVMTVSGGAIGLMSLQYRRSHGLLRRYLRTSAQADAATREAERQRSTLDAILTNAPTAIVIAEVNDRVLGVNAAFERMFRCGFDDVNGLPLRDVVLGDASDLNLPELLDDLAPTEYTRYRRDGSEVNVLVSSGTVRDDARGVRVVAYEDLSSVVEARRAIEDAKEQYRQLVEASPDLVWRADRYGRWTFVNEAARSLYDIDPEDLIGRPIVERVDSQCIQSHKTAARAVMAGAELVDHRTMHRDAGGRLKHLSVSMRRLVDAGGAVVGVQGVARDITVVVDGIAALEETRAEAERYAASRSRFLANVSHEVRTPLNGLLGMTEILLDTDLDQEQRRSVDLIQTSAAALLSILNDVLDHSKIEAGGMVLEPLSVDLTALVDSVVRLQAVEAFEKRIELAYDIEPEVPRHIVADPGRLRQVLSNLVANAVKFTKKGEIVVTVSCAKRGKNRAVVAFGIRDTGIGIAPERLHSIFDEYVQSDASVSRRFGGTGLGLAIARQLVRMMGGDIAVESGEGTGSVFRFAIPVECQPTPRVSTSRRVALFGERVLVVGSNGASRSIIVDQLRRAGLDVSEAADRRATSSALAHAPAGFAAMILDAHVAGGSDSFDVAEWIVREHPGTPLMMLTAAGQRGDAQRCRDLGVAAYLTKPVARTELLEATASVVSGRSSERDGQDTLITRYSIAESRQPMRVLYAEDNPVNRTVAVSMLGRRGHHVTAVVDGESAVREWKDGVFDVVLMDINLPGVSGVDAMRLMRDLMPDGDVPIIAVTAHGMPGRREEILTEGFDRVLLKPFASAELFAAVEGWDVDSTAATWEWDTMPPDDSGPVEWEALLGSMREAGIVDALPSIVGVFGADAPRRMAAVRHAVVARDATQVESAAHAFKSAAGTIMASRLAAMLHDLEREGRAGRSAGWNELVRKIDAELKRVCESLTEVKVGQ